MYPTKGCGDCAACRDGRTHHCASFTVSGVHRDGGSFAEYVVAPVDQLIKLPESLRSIHGALAEPATVGVHANLQGGMAAGKRVAVIGAGTIGSMIAQVARGWGAADVVIVDRMPARRALAADLGFDHFVLSGAGGEEEDCFRSGARSTSYSTTRAPSRPSNSATNTLEIGGTLVALTFPHAGQQLIAPYTTAYRRELHIVFSRNYARGDWDLTFDLMEKGAIDTERMISGNYQLDQFVEAMDDLRDHPDEHVKVVISP